MSTSRNLRDKKKYFFTFKNNFNELSEANKTCIGQKFKLLISEKISILKTICQITILSKEKEQIKDDQDSDLAHWRMQPKSEKLLEIMSPLTINSQVNSLHTKSLT